MIFNHYNFNRTIINIAGNASDLVNEPLQKLPECGQLQYQRYADIPTISSNPNPSCDLGQQFLINSSEVRYESSLLEYVLSLNSGGFHFQKIINPDVFTSTIWMLHKSNRKSMGDSEKIRVILNYIIGSMMRTIKIQESNLLKVQISFF